MTSLQEMCVVVVSGLSGSEKFFQHVVCRNLIIFLKTSSDQLETLFSLKHC